ncbi:molecular chaperone HtpG [Wenzhouxiangella marina]|uniref:Chaperone protein HtpG n=1 Tax=Wenzhouxiangella marina TaxID=1579979 RepID=A0A0K0XWD7_9GAMM|nr:molecular chaperone HtpG [Wenzhouxiangella marina]AKS41993.1 Chaperone protein HtpG [Wenzhouxiangella marina]MBB6086240.1 molecular chaperone HtpG [Wenzhouxiangella marina]
MSQTSNTETRAFDTEVHQLLKLMINALYSNREIFLRELISNASDASDKLRFEALTKEALKGLDQDLGIDVHFDAEKHQLRVVDRGIGMSRDEVIENLGTIARSGTRRFLDSLSGDQKKDARLIGQFGVGFYAAFIVASEVQVETRRADLPPGEGVRWISSGEGEYRIESIDRPEQGTVVTLSLREEHRDLLDRWVLERIIRHYSNHVAFPIRLLDESRPGDSEGDGSSLVNDSQAIWARSKAELEDEDYKSFYRSLGMDASDPVSWAHHHVEGTQSYSLLLYLPGQAPFDLLTNRDEREGLKLCIQRVFIMDAAEQLLPRYLRFMRGVVDSADLPLNVSRELLQDSPLLKKIRATVVKRSLDLIEKLAEAGGEPWERFWSAFGSVLKEGVIEDHEQRERIARLLRFASTRSDGEHSVGLDDYIERMGKDQDTIWYLTADSLRVARSSPHLEAFRARDIEVLLLTDRIDEWLVAHLDEYQGKTLKSVARGKLELGEEADAPDASATALAGRIKQVLGDRVGNVIPGRRLTESPACIVSDEHGMSLQMQKLLRQAGQEVPETKPELEINPTHAVVELMAAEQDEERFGELAQLLFDQALLAEGGELSDPAAYVRRVNALLVSALAPTPTEGDKDASASAGA